MDGVQPAARQPALTQQQQIVKRKLGIVYGLGVLTVTNAMARHVEGFAYGVQVKPD